MTSQFSIQIMCRALKVSRSGFYEYRHSCNRPKGSEEELKTQIQRIHKESRRTYGHRSIRHALKKQNLHVGRKRVLRLMKQMQLKSTPLRRNPYGALKNAQESSVSKHRLRRQFIAKRPGRQWSGDITYIWTQQGWVYLAVVLDLFSRRVVGWALSDKPDTALVIQALDNALVKRSYRRWRLMFHSDQGCQYTAKALRDYLRERGILQSMSRRGQCWDNAPTESFFGTLKQETGLGRFILPTMEAVQSELFEWIETWYNLRRRHSTLGYCSPAEFELNWVV